VTDSDLTLIAALLDRSGSMATIKTDTEGGFRTFLADQREQPGRLEVTLAQFDDKYELVYPPTPAAEVPDFVLSPRGSTALLDALGRFITDIGAKLAERPEEQRPGTVIVVVMTDGVENSSCEWNIGEIRELVTSQREQWQWQFVFLGANLDAVAVGRNMGMAAGQTIAYAATSAGTHAVMHSVSRSTTDMRTGGDGHFTNTERDDAAAT